MNNISDLICKNCHSCVMRDHPETRMEHEWLKCGICGYCEKKDLEKIKKIIENQSIFKDSK